MPSLDELNAQQQHWDLTFAGRPNMFGTAPSDAARAAAGVFAAEGRTDLLELGAGQGRDTLFFAREGFRVTAVDYTQAAVDSLAAASNVIPVRHDVREPLPFGADSFDACYSHMLYCMALTTPQLERLAAEVLRVLRPGGLNVYTARTIEDGHYGTGIHRGEDMYEVGGFIVHFFSSDKVQRLAAGYEIVSVERFEEGGLPRKLYRVTLRKPARLRAG